MCARLEVVVVSCNRHKCSYGKAVDKILWWPECQVDLLLLMMKSWKFQLLHFAAKGYFFKWENDVFCNKLGEKIKCQNKKSEHTIVYNRFETSVAWFETLKKQLLLHKHSVVVETGERRERMWGRCCCFLSCCCVAVLHGSFLSLSSRNPVFTFWRGKKRISDAFEQRHHT